MTFISVVETFGAVVVALGGLETFKWVKRTWFPSKNEKRQDKSEADKSMVEVAQSVQNLETSINGMWKENLENLSRIDTERLQELRNTNKTLNEHNTDLTKQVADCQKEIARLNEIISDKVRKIRELEEARLGDTKRYESEITALTKRNGELEKLVMFYRAWHCEREYGNKKEDCKRRKPAQNPPLRYCPIEERAVSETRIPLCEVSTNINTDVVAELIPETPPKTTKTTKRSKTRLHPDEFKQ